MNRFLPFLLILLFALLLCPRTTPAQQVESAKTDPEEAALREKAFAVLDSLANQIGSLQSAENRARVGANIAESLWRHDEKRARTLFQMVEEDIKLGLQAHQNAPFHHQDLQVFLKLRDDMVRRIAKHDAELALQFLRETFPLVKKVQSFSDGSFRVEAAAREKALEVELSRALARNSAESALKLARKTLAEGFDNGLLMLLVQLNDKHKDEARVLHKEIVSKLGGADFRSDGTLDFSLKLIQYFSPPAADDATYRELLELLLKTASANGCASTPAGSQKHTQAAQPGQGPG